MPLQGRNLVIVGLGSVGDAPPNHVQPPLADGIHLRWAFDPELGFPPYGFYVFRRPHKDAAPRCLSKMKLTRNLTPESSPGSEFDIPTLGRVSSDGSIALTEDFAPSGSVEFDLEGREYLRVTLARENLAYRIDLRIGFRQDAQIRVSAFAGDTTSAQVTVWGQAGDIKSARLESDAISDVELSGGPAALVELRFVPVAENATVGWEPLPDFPYPMSMPLTHPDYPCGGARSEDLAAARALAGGRILYGDPNQFTGARALLTSAGTVSVLSDSQIVVGVGTSWGEELVGGVLQVNGDRTGFGVAAVLGRDKLVLSRPYNGSSAAGLTYAVHHDPFGQLHDYLVHLVAGGSAAGPMNSRSLPVPVATGGAIIVTVGSSEVVGLGTGWGPELTGLALQAVRDSTGIVAVSNGSCLVRGVGTAWSHELAGLALRLEHDRAVYTIIGVEPASQLLVLDRSYAGATGTGRAYAIAEKAAYNIAAVDSATRLKLDREYHAHGAPGSTYTLAYSIGARLPPAKHGETAPSVPRQYPLDIVLLAALHPAVAQMLGLYWVDRRASPGVAYDYLIVADHYGRYKDEWREVLRHLSTEGFADVDGYIIFNRKAEPSAALLPPDDVRAFDLPGMTAQERGPLAARPPDAQNLSGLRWAQSPAGWGSLTGHTVMYHVWRAKLGDGETPDPLTHSKLITDGRPIIPADPEAAPGRIPERPPDWPPFPLHFIDQRLPDGWYGYQLSGIDIFGRHSPNSTAAWHQWTPAPEPRPWYYEEARGDGAVHPAAIRLLNKTAPPPPTGVEAHALDPSDPLILRDEAYETWRAANPETCGLRVRWLWTQAHIRQAPDTREFRIYYQPGQMNAWTGKTLRVSVMSATESTVETDVANTRPADAYAGARLRIRADSFRVLGSEAGSPLRLRVRHAGPFYLTGTIELANGSAVVNGSGTDWGPELAGLVLRAEGEETAYNIARVDSPTRLILKRAYAGAGGAGRSYTIIGVVPNSDAPCTLALPSPHTAGTVMLVNGSPVVIGTNTNWGAEMAGSLFKGVAGQTEYQIVRVDSPTQLALDRGYEGSGRAVSTYSIRHPLVVDYSAPNAWHERIYVVGYDEHVTKITDPAVTGGGDPVRRYEVFLPAPDAAEGQPFSPSLADPLVYAHIGVSAADDKPHTPDDPRWAAGRWGGRHGNEGRLGPQATIFRVRRERPPAPIPPPDAERVFATAADYYSLSYYTYRWRPLAHLKAHIFRALDDSVFQTDWNRRQPPRPLRPALAASDFEYFPAEWRADDDSTRLRRRSVAEALNHLNEFGRDTAGKEQAMAYYRSLSNDALRVLAGLPGNEAAFSQITIEPLDPDDPANADRIGPDNPPDFSVDLGLRIYIDALDGRSTNRYFYRAQYLDEAHNRSGLSLSSPPVYLPDVVPPRVPVLTQVLSGERQISLSWASNREPDLSAYRVYRAAGKEAARDLRLMELVHTETVSVTEPAARPPEISWVDVGLTGGTRYYYRLVAVDQVGNVSEPSAALSASVVDTRIPEPPVWFRPVWLIVRSPDGLEEAWPADGVIRAGQQPVLRLEWMSDFAGAKFVVLRRTRREQFWKPIAAEGDYQSIAATRFRLDDGDVTPGQNYSYRIRVMSPTGISSIMFRELEVARPQLG